jgi:hypothetical protein
LVRAFAIFLVRIVEVKAVVKMVRVDRGDREQHCYGENCWNFCAYQLKKESISPETSPTWC